MGDNVSEAGVSEALNGDPAYILFPITVLYSLIFVTGLIGNVSTCVVIARNKHMHTATNYYLFSLAISDLLLLLSGLPPEVYLLWVKTYVFGETFCILTGFAAETCANATVLTITAFTIERYVAICHPFLSHTFSKLSRAVKSVIVIWLAALFLAVPQAIQFGVVKIVTKVPNSTITEEALHCTLLNTRPWLKYSFQISTVVFFVAPMSLITGLYLLIGVKLRRKRLIKRPNNEPFRAQKHVIRMLVAVVVGFFICWAPFHAQRLLAVYATQEEPSSLLVAVYKALTHVSGVLYYLSTIVNPLLYNIMSHKFREAFKNTLAHLCGQGKGTTSAKRTYSVLSRANTQLVRCDTETRKLRQAPVPATISNSSLQDAGVQEEYSGAELASYMGQLNTR